MFIFSKKKRLMIGGWNPRLPPDPLESVALWFTEDIQVAIERCVKHVESSDNASCQIYHFCDVSQEACRPLHGQVYFLFFIGKSCLAPFFKGNNHPYIRVNGWYCVSSAKKILTKKLELSIDRFPFWTDFMTVIRCIANESKRFRTYVANRIAVRI